MNAPVDVSFFARAAKPLTSYRKYWAARFGTAKFLPMSRKEMDALGWDSCDIILVTGDAYVDHPSFGMAVIGRMLEAQGFRVGIIAQPDWTSAEAFKALQGYGISKEQALAKLRVQGEADIGQEQLLILRGLLTAIKEGDTTPEQAFAPEDGAQTGVTMPPRKPPATTTAPPVAEPPAQPSADGAQEPLPAAMPAPAPAPAATAPAGEFMATTAEKQHLRQKATHAGVDLSMALTAAGVEVDPDTLDGLTKRQFHAVKSKLPA